MKRQQINIRVTPELYEELLGHAQNDLRSVSNWIIKILSDFIRPARTVQPSGSNFQQDRQ